MKFMRAILIGFFMLSSAFAASETPRDHVERILAQEPLPPGIVFEIMAGEADALNSLLPKVEELAAYIGDVAPQLDLAVVSHGNEMFALKSSEGFVHEEAHRSAKRLVDARVDVYICGAYANMRQVDWDAFLPFVVVAESGPAQVNDYRALGYEIVFIGDPNYTPVTD